MSPVKVGRIFAALKAIVVGYVNSVTVDRVLIALKLQLSTLTLDKKYSVFYVLGSSKDTGISTLKVNRIFLVLKATVVRYVNSDD